MSFKSRCISEKLYYQPSALDQMIVSLTGDDVYAALLSVIVTVETFEFSSQ
jgi:hypothetical protein